LSRKSGRVGGTETPEFAGGVFAAYDRACGTRGGLWAAMCDGTREGDPKRCVGLSYDCPPTRGGGFISGVAVLVVVLLVVTVLACAGFPAGDSTASGVSTDSDRQTPYYLPLEPE
jgi:hypothetical protein